MIFPSYVKFTRMYTTVILRFCYGCSYHFLLASTTGHVAVAGKAPSATARWAAGGTSPTSGGAPRGPSAGGVSITPWTFTTKHFRDEMRYVICDMYMCIYKIILLLIITTRIITIINNNNCNIYICTYIYIYIYTYIISNKSI